MPEPKHQAKVPGLGLNLGGNNPQAMIPSLKLQEVENSLESYPNSAKSES